MARVWAAEDGIRMRFEEAETGLLRQLAKEMKALLEAEIPRVDPVVSRIFPSAYEDDAEEEKYRELVGDELRQEKLGALHVVESSLDAPEPLDEEGARAWMITLTDMRLAIGTRMGVTEERMGQDIDADDPEGPAMAVLHWLGFLQEMLVEASNPDEDGD